MDECRRPVAIYFYVGCLISMRGVLRCWRRWQERRKEARRFDRFPVMGGGVCALKTKYIECGIQNIESSPDTGRRGARGRANWKRAMMPSVRHRQRATGTVAIHERWEKVENGVSEGGWRPVFMKNGCAQLHVFTRFYTLLHKVSGG